MQTRIERLKYELGDALVQFSHLEWFVTFMAAALMEESPEICLGILGELSFRKKVDVLAALLRYRPLAPDIASRAQQALKLVYRSEEGRNRLVHSTWTLGPREHDSVFRLKPTARGKMGFDLGFRKISEDEVAEVSRSIKEAVVALSECAESLQEMKLLKFNLLNKNA